MLACPLCCDEEFEDATGLVAHLNSAYKRLKCPLCNTRFDNLMVMIKHLERGGCISAVNKSGDKSMEKNPVKEDTSSVNENDMSTEHFADDSDNEADPKNTTDGQAEEPETISEDQYMDKNGQMYRRRVVKISNLWSELDSVKQEQETEAETRREPRAKVPYGSAECPLCYKVFKGQHSLRLHLEVAHRGLTHTCVYCHRVFQSESTLNEHVQERHSMPYSCVYCNKPFNNLALAKKHVECHKEKKKAAYACELCDETAQSSAEIKRHYKEAHVHELQPRDAPTMIAPYKKGSLWYEWRGYTYHQTAVTRAGVQVLKCWVDGCWAEVRVPVIGSVASQGTHSHPPYEWLKERNEMYNALRRRCMTETTPIRIIYDEEAYRFPVGAKNLVFQEATMRKWQKCVRNQMDDQTLQITLQDDGSLTWVGDDSEIMPDNIESTNSYARKRKSSQQLDTFLK